MHKQISSIGNAVQTAWDNNADAWGGTRTLPGYQITEQLYAGSRTLVYRSIRNSDGKQVILKLLRNEMPTFSELVQFRNQYAIMRGITDSSNTNIRSGIIQPYSLENCGNGYILVMEEFGGISLSQFTQKQPLDIVAFLNIAIQLADILHQLYQHRVIHKDIKPANILIHPGSKQVKLIDFSISSLLPRETQEIQNPNVLEGTIAYLSPEQTGRMNRGIDYRSDFYSLGVTFYQLLAGKLPFQADDAMELIHCHLAKTPQPLHEVNSSVPVVLSQIVAKLMAKNAESRYQSAMGLKRDLEICLHQWKEIETIAHFAIAQEDRCDRFIIPEKLYGRETEVAALLAAFDRVASLDRENRIANPPESGRTRGQHRPYKGGSTLSSRSQAVPGNADLEALPPVSREAPQSELMLVAGFSGIGKTAVVNEVHKPIVRQKGYFIKGKFDQFQRNIPFSAFVQAFRDLMAQLLGETKTKLEQWRTLILQAVGENGQVITDVIPELERIIGKQPPVPELSGSAAQNRFNLLFQKFIQVFTTKEHPLVMFLDDLQWADSASLNLLKLLLSETETGYLLVLGAYRDNEVFPAHPLMLALEEIKKARATINTITLTPLDRADINQLVADTLNCSTELAQPLTDLTYQKTNGNPFFATQFLKALYGDRAIAFNLQENHWECDLAQVKTATLTSDVVEFMAAQLRKLPVETQEMLKLAACIGNSFDLTTLAIVSEKSQTDATTDLWKALQEGLILPISETYKFFQFGDAVSTREISVPYRFLHDRVQQAAYSLIPEEQKQATHLKIGQLLQQNLSEIEKEEKLFDIVGHLNLATELITQVEERSALAQVNLAAAQKAKNSTAYAAARNFVQTGIELLAANCWLSQYELTLNLYVAAAETAYLNADFEGMEAMAEEVLQSAQTILDKVKIYEIQILALTAQSQMLEAIAVGQNALAQLGVQFSSEPDEILTGKALQALAEQLQGKQIEELVNLPVISDRKTIAAMQLLAMLFVPIFLGNPALLPLLGSIMVSLSLQFGNAPASSIGYVTYGAVMSAFLGEVERGYRFGKVALSLLNHFNVRKYKCLTLLLFGSFLLHRTEALTAKIITMKQGYLAGMETGDFLYAGYNISNYLYDNFFAGVVLDDWELEIENYCVVLAHVKQDSPLAYLKMIQQMVHNLREILNQPDLLSGTAYDETVMLPKHHQDNELTALAFVYIYKMILAYLFSKYSNALDYTAQANQYLMAVAGTFHTPVFHFYAGLTYLALCSTFSEIEVETLNSTSLLAQVETHQTTLAQWAQYAPMNHGHKVDLLEAEKCRIFGKNYEAGDLYDRAISGAKANEYLQEEALANELAAKFYLDWGKEKVAAGYMQEAYYCYAKWGAKAKIVDLETRYPQLLTPILQRSIASENSSLATSVNTLVSLHQTVSSTSSSISNLLDLGTVMKAAQALYSEIHLDKLLATLMQVIVENSGADKAALFLDRDGELEVVIKYLDNTILCLSPKPVDECQHFPTGVVRYVDRTLESVITDAKTHPSIASDPYFIKYQPQSLLCTPILNQSKLIGVLYVENSLTSQAFTSDRLELLKFLCSQAAISLQNARLYQQSQTYAAQLNQKSQQLEQTLAELQTMQLQLVQNEKMSALGNLVAGVAHEINNPVGCIIGNVNATQDYINDLLDIIDLYQDKFPQPGAEIAGELENIDLDYVREDLPKLIKAMKDGGSRITSISKSLRTFSRADSDNKQKFNLHEGIDSTLLILRHRLKANEHRPAIEVVTDYGKIPEIACFPGQLNQVFMNILANAIDALDESNSGRSYQEIQAHPNRITIETKIEGGGVKIAIADNGPGMSEEVKARIFDHLFTTKAVGKGTGLGLAIARQIIVEKHGGSIDVDSVLGQGTIFTLQLPIEA
ncbi:MAG: AAA family ATPase [Oscillatoriaceae cyanobacterium Prado104]|jgi:predicted ATPase/signal transduction histidine kinase|nr:AAA family ATPase [Oscillatoriaceae cyanobacterium Prado104]